MKFDDLIAHMLSYKFRTLGHGATDEEIDEASKRLGVPIQGGYRAFLRRFGYGGVGGHEMYGLGTGVPEHLHLVLMTQSERTEMEPNIPPHLLPIYNNGGGDHACLDTQASPDEPPVVMWYHEDGPDQVPGVEAPDFASWLANALNE